MSWAEIKKSINSDLETPLNSLITNTQNQINSVNSSLRTHIGNANTAIRNLINNTNNAVINRINTAQTAIQAEGGVKIVKSVQYGRATVPGNRNSSNVFTNAAIGSTTVVMSNVNSARSIVILDALNPIGNVNVGSDTPFVPSAGAELYGFSNNTITIRSVVANGKNAQNSMVSWQVIEFY